MTPYDAPESLVRIASRYQNHRRRYLLVNPLQGKHIPVSPGKALAMMEALGQRLFQAAPDAQVILGFAETATAITAAAACVFPGDVFVLHTTREELPEAHTIFFAEEHSHATEQKVYAGRLIQHPGQKAILIDDEISTGRTMENAIRTLSRRLPTQFGSYLIGSILSRMTAPQLQRLEELGADCLSLVQPHLEGLEEQAAAYPVTAPTLIQPHQTAAYTELFPVQPLPDLRYGTVVHHLRHALAAFADGIWRQLSGALVNCPRLLFLGTEECMLPALYVADQWQRRTAASIYCHATTRSPIGICTQPGYPIQNGVQLASFYAAHRTTYLYNLQPYDAVVVITDSQDRTQIRAAMQDLMTAFEGLCGRFYCIGAQLQNEERSPI